jgi:cytochrome c oxidase accessory protein FixG
VLHALDLWRPACGPCGCPDFFKASLTYSLEVSLNEQKEIASGLDDLYSDAAHWHVNIGDEVIHAKRMPGRFRNLKWFSMLLWAFFFIGPYLRWHGHQALLFDIPGRKFYLFGITIWPQDVWMLSLVLILLAMTLFGVTAVASRVWCGYFCFQTAWVDVFVWIENIFEGNPIQRRKLDAAPWSGKKVLIKVKKHILWLLISILTGVTFVAYFTDAIGLWIDYFTLQAPLVAWVVLLIFVQGTYILAGFMREQVCFWLCPYARIQGVMIDKDTIMPTYDFRRGEPRGRLKKGNSRIDSGRGDCIDCNMCVAVCPTGVDIREGLQEGCITCGLCIDACDSIMEKVDRPKGLIRYFSLKEMEGGSLPPLFRRPRVITYSAIFLLSVLGILFGLTHIPPVELSVVHERQPLFVRMSDGSIQNKYTIKAVNKTTEDIRVEISIDGIKNLYLANSENEAVVLKAGKVIPFNLFLRAQPADLKEKHTPIHITLKDIGTSGIAVEYKSVFIGPAR